MPPPHDWETIAETYARRAAAKDLCLRDLGDLFWQTLGPLPGRRVLDLACGPGILTAELSRRGADVTAIDLSEPLLAEARKRAPKVRFIRHDLSTGLPPLDGRFDLAVCHMALMDIPEPYPLLADLAKTLEPNGRFVFTIPHPVFFGQPRGKDTSGTPAKMVRRYLSLRTDRVATFGGHDHHHRPLSWYVGLLKTTGFAVTDLLEPPHRMARRNPLAPWYLEFPAHCLFACRRLPPAP